MKKVIMNKWFYIILFYTIIMVSMLILVKIVDGQIIEPGVCYAQNITVGLNETYNATISICANNCSFNPVVYNYSIELVAGQNISYSNATCNVDAFCVAGSGESPRCVYNENLKPGDDVNIFSESCDIDIEVEECEDQECSTELPTTYTERYSIQYNGFDDEIEIQFSDKVYRYTLGNNSDFDISNTISYTCPTVIDDETVNPDDILTQCKSVVPVYCTDLTKILMNRFDSCEGRKNDLANDLKQCQDTMALSVCVESKHYAELLAKQTNLINESERCSFQEGRLTRDLEREKTWSTELGFFVLFLVGLNAYQWARPRYLDRKSSIG